MIFFYRYVVGDKNLPSPSLAAFLNIVSSIQQIETVLDKLLLLPELSSDVHVTKLSSVLCDWLLQWPKAPKVANWVISLFKMLTLDNRSSIVAGVISKKAPKVGSAKKCKHIKHVQLIYAYS